MLLLTWCSAAGLGLLENPIDDQVSLVRLIENFNRFILEQLHKETISHKAIDTQHTTIPIIDQLFGSTVFSMSKCLSCKHTMTRETRSFQYDLTPSDKAGNDSFAALLRSSIARENHTKAWCDKCARYQLTEQKRYLVSLPNILCINSAAAANKDIDFWKSKYGTLSPLILINSESEQMKSNNPAASEVTSWLPSKIRIKIDSSSHDIQFEENPTNSSDLSSHHAVYQLTVHRGMVINNVRLSSLMYMIHRKRQASTPT